MPNCIKSIFIGIRTSYCCVKLLKVLSWLFLSGSCLMLSVVVADFNHTAFCYFN